MSGDLVLRPVCDRCGSSSELYGSNCKHLTLCFTCGKAMAQNGAKCNYCFVVVSRLIREYNVRASASTEKTLCIGRFITGLPPFSKKKSTENKWTLHKEGIQGHQLTNGLQEIHKYRTLVLEDETGQHQYQGQQLEGAQSATYYLLMLQGKEFTAVPARSWHNFNKIAQYKQLTLEEAEEKMNRRRNNATGYERWMMKAATNGPAAFGEMERDEVLNNCAYDNDRPKKGKSNDEKLFGNGVETVEQEARKKKLAPNTKSIDDDDGDGTIKGVYDLDGDDIEKGDDWEHEETFTDDDEAVGNDPEEREDLAPDAPAPPEIKQDDEDEDEEEGGLSKSGKELKKLLGRVSGQNGSDADDDDEDEDEDEDEDVMDNGMSPVLAPKGKGALKDEASENNRSKSLPSGSAKGTPSTKSSKSKRKPGTDYVKSPNGAPAKKIKTENESRLASIKDEPPTSKPNFTSKASTLTSSCAPVTADEIRAVLSSTAPLTAQDLVARFKGRLKSQEDKSTFADILKKMSKIQKASDGGPSYVVLRDK